jgi:hypothetical protein
MRRRKELHILLTNGRRVLQIVPSARRGDGQSVMARVGKEYQLCWPTGKEQDSRLSQLNGEGKYYQLCQPMEE